MSNGPHVELRSVTKRFGATVALSGVNLTIRRGHVHALVGENGAGKSTLARLIAGDHLADEGELLLAGRPVQLRSPRQALEQGITIVAQELSLLPARSIEENIYLGQEPHRGPFVTKGTLRRRFTDLAAKTGIELDPDAQVGRLSVSEQQRVEIMRALARNAELIVMDEPTARLTAHEAEALGQIMRRLSAQGTTIILVSHFLEEVLEVADTITVMRDGRVVRTRAADEESQSSLTHAMIGRPLEAAFPAKTVPHAGARQVLSVEGLSRQGSFENVSLSCRAGEILVLTGLVGAGRSEVAHAIYGARRPTSGTIRLNGKVFSARHPVQAIEHGIAMIPEARKTEGLQLSRSVRENITLSHLKTLSRLGMVRRGHESRVARDAIKQTGLKASSPDAALRTLSGGNQQKVLFARALLQNPSLLIADEPTRGVDVGAKRAIYDLLAEQARNGLAVLVITSEIEEAIGLAHRVLVMRTGTISAELQGDEINEANIIAAAFGGVPDFLETEDTK